MQLICLINKENYIESEVKIIEDSEIKAVVQYVYGDGDESLIARMENWKQSNGISYFEVGSNKVKIYLKNGSILFAFADKEIINKYFKNLYTIVHI